MSKISEEYRSDHPLRKRAKQSNSPIRDENIANREDAPLHSEAGSVRQNTRHNPPKITTERRENRHYRESSETLFDQELDELIREIEGTNLGSSFIPISPLSDKTSTRRLKSPLPPLISETAPGEKRKLSTSEDRTSSSELSSLTPSPKNLKKKTKFMER